MVGGGSHRRYEAVAPRRASKRMVPGINTGPAMAGAGKRNINGSDGDYKADTDHKTETEAVEAIRILITIAMITLIIK